MIAAMVHLVSVLLMPTLAPKDAFARLTDYAKKTGIAEGLVMLEPPSLGSTGVLPFEDPSFVEAACLYDISKRPYHLKASTDGDNFFALSFYATGGRIYHAITDRSAIKGKFDIILGNERQIEALENAGDGSAPVQEVRLTAPTSRGFIFIRALAKRNSDVTHLQELLKNARCENFELPKE
jgi:uncharacterized membrane protein